MLNRTIAPPTHEIPEIKIPTLEKVVLDNGLTIHVLPLHNTPIVDFNISFNAGSILEKKMLVASFANRQMQEGTASHSGLQIADHFDFYGATLKLNCGTDEAIVGFNALEKHFSSLLPMIQEMILQPAFSEKELLNNINRNKESFKQSMQKPEYLCKRIFSNAMFGSQHPYGRVLEETHYDAVNTDDLKQFHQQYYLPNNAFILLSGDVNDKMIQQIENLFSSKTFAAKALQPTENFTATISAERKIHQARENAVQSSIRIGQHTIDRINADANILRLTNTILGGYFGSRLMMNIREDKGYTYGIHSGISFNKLGNYQYVKTEVGKEVCADAIKEIYKEIEILQNEKVDADELDKVKNYMLGSYLEDLGNIFQMSSLYLSYLQQCLTLDDYYAAIETIRNTSTEQILACAQKYYNTKEMVEVAVG
jgi:zinc protease